MQAENLRVLADGFVNRNSLREGLTVKQRTAAEMTPSLLLLEVRNPWAAQQYHPAFLKHKLWVLGVKSDFIMLPVQSMAKLLDRVGGEHWGFISLCLQFCGQSCDYTELT